MNRIVRLFAIITIGVILAGCKETLNSELAEREANEIVATLYLQDIAADKLVGKDGLYSVTVRQADFGAAIAVLARAGLPRENFRSIGDVFPDDSVVGTAFEERARFSFALSQEISRTLTEIEGVQFARVHVVIPEKGRFADEAPPSKAAIALYHSREFDDTVAMPQIKQLAASAVPNLTYDAVSVSMFPASELSDVVVQPVGPSGLGRAANAIGVPSLDATDKFDFLGGDVAAMFVLTFLTLLMMIAMLKMLQLGQALVVRMMANAH